MNSITLFKVLNEDGTPFWCGDGKWSLPNNGQSSEWMPKVEEIEPCHSGYHLCRGTEHLLHWLGPVVYEAEVRGEIVEVSNKVVVGEVRLVCKVDTWNDRTARLFACDCAERVLPIFERERPDDCRPRAAISMARKLANGDATWDQLAAAGVAAKSAAGSAAWDAAWDAVRDAAWAAAGASSRATAWAAAGSAAWDAVRASAWDAARVAACDAAGAFAWDAARDAASAAERKWQAKRLREYLEGRIG